MASKVSASIGGKYNAVLQQTMLRIKDPKVSVPFYEKHFGMKLVHKYDFPEWKFSLYFLERVHPDAVAAVKAIEGGVDGVSSVETEKYLWDLKGQHVLELTHNHGSETDDNFGIWSGNTGKDLPDTSPLYVKDGPVRGFGHIAFNVDDVYQFSKKLDESGVKFQKKPDEGRMKGLAFALDPDGYWLEICSRGTNAEGKSWFPEAEANLSQTLCRVKDAAASLQFYQDVLGMTLVRKMEIPGDFTNYFLASKFLPEEEKRWKEEVNEDPTSDNARSFTKSLWYPVLELTHNHGTEKDPEFVIDNGNGAVHQGFGHIGFIVDDLEKCCDEMLALGIPFSKKPSDGNMKTLAFALDPSGYKIELIQRNMGMGGVCANF